NRMDIKLFEASQTGDIDYLSRILREQPLILNNVALFSTQNPLHTASLAGHVDFVKNILMLKPEFAPEINQDGFTPMHFAAANGHIEIVKELLQADPGLCRVQGKERKTPLHFAAIKGRTEILSAMLSACPDCVQDVTVQGETALYLAVKYNQFEAIRVLVEKIREMDKEDVFRVKDEQGNTILHLATGRKQRQVIELFLASGNISSGFIEVNAINHSGLTAFDMLLIYPSEAGDREIAEILQGAGAMKARDINPPPDSTLHSVTVNIPNSGETFRISQPDYLVEYFKFKKGRDSPSDARTALLVIAVLVATATFQVGVSPPGGFWQDTHIPDQSNSTGSTISEAHFAGNSILATSKPVAFCLIVFSNSIGLTVSLYMINVLTSRFPLQLELQICMAAMFFTYNTSVIDISADQVKLYVILTTAILSVFTPIVVRWIRLYAKRNIIKTMDMGLFEAAQTGNVDFLQQLLRENPISFCNFALLSAENPLNIACTMGHVDFVKEFIRLKPEFSKEVNQEGISPMHIAAANGHVEIVRELMIVDSRLCLLDGRAKKTPLHYAAIKGRVEVIKEMLLGCPDCIEMVTVQRETALHLAVRNGHFEATKVLMDWVRENNKEDMLNMKDELGNTVLHLAAWKKQRQASFPISLFPVMELLLGTKSHGPRSLEVNAINQNGLTALDVLRMFPSEAGDAEIVEILQGAGGMRARDVIPQVTPDHQTLNSPTRPDTNRSQSTTLVEYFKFKRGRDSPSEARGTLLLIATFIATTTFQVGVNPPGGFWQDTNIADNSNSTSNQAHIAGQAVLATTNKTAFALLVIFNSIGLNASLYMIYVLTSKFPLQFELQICMLAMFCTYNTALPNISQNLFLYVQITTTIMSSALPFVVKFIRRFLKLENTKIRRHT
ncbi:hypothetical protein Tsubulata_047351, partial [Turnera subulata]